MLYSRHCWLDEDGLYGECFIGKGYYRFRVTHRWSKHVIWDHYVRGGTEAFYECGRRWSDYVMAQWVKRAAAPDGVARGERALDEELALSHPALHEHLTLDWLDGGVRETSTLTISSEAGRWRARLCDRDNGLVCFITGDGFHAVLGALERSLVEDTADWRVDQFAKRPGKKKP